MDGIKDRITSKVKPKRDTAYNAWKEAVLETYPNVFFPTLSPKKKKILDSVDKAIERSGIDRATFFRWIVVNWTVLHNKTGIARFAKYPYPELDLVMYNYDQLINHFNTLPKLVNPNPKKQVRLRFL